MTEAEKTPEADTAPEPAPTPEQEAHRRAQQCHDAIADACARFDCRLSPHVVQKSVGDDGSEFLTSITFRIVANMQQ